MEALVDPKSDPPAFWRGKRVLVTGHTGFKGAWLCLWLKELGASITGLALAPDTEPSLFDILGLVAEMDSRVGDIRDLATVTRAFEETKPEIVLHLAAQPLVRHAVREPVATFATNVMGTAHVLEASRIAGTVRASVVVTTDKCYENRETGRAFVEEDRLGGLDPYSSSKAAAELVTHAYRATYFNGDCGLATARAGNVIGGGDWAHERLMPDIVSALVANQAVPLRYPQSTRPWQHVLDPLRGYLLLAQALYEDPGSFSEPWNFGPSDAPLSVAAVTERAFEQWPGSPTPPWVQTPSGDAKEAGKLRIDPSKAQRRLGWHAKLTQEEAVDWTISWYRRWHATGDALAVTREQLGSFEALL